MQFVELYYYVCLPVAYLPCSAWVLLSYVLQTIFLHPVHVLKSRGEFGRHFGTIFEFGKRVIKCSIVQLIWHTELSGSFFILMV